MFNPFPGLRPFEPDEEHLFFGREAEVDDLLRRLRTSRLLAVVGTSGSGKSSLVRSGLIPALQSGLMSGAGSGWRIAMFRPGEDPIGHLVRALDAPGVIGNPDLADISHVLLEVTVRRSSLGLAEAVRQARLPRGENVLIVVDQFEELFRYRRSRQIENSRDEAIAFVRLLLEAAAKPAHNIFVVLTMRSDFIGDCMNFPGLPEAVNAGLYLVGRMSRDALRAAITGPVAVAGGTIAPRLVNRVLNDLGDDHDQLPLVQHALMRTWDDWAAAGDHAAPLDLEHYERVGTIREALSKHAEEAYQDADAEGLSGLAERVFKALTDTFTDARGVRRPTSVRELAAICETDEGEVIRVVELFRRPGRSFLTPPATVALTGASIIDISHESLMRCWGRLIAWAEAERSAAEFYVRLSHAALWHEQGAAGLWRDPELELAQRWRLETRPTEAWALRYDPGFERALTFLDSSLAAREREAAAIEHERRAKLRRTQTAAAVLATLLLVTAALGAFAWSERQRAQHNLDLAREAVDESLAATDRDTGAVGADVPQVEELRRELLAKAERFYLAFMAQQPRSEAARRDLAFAHLRLGHINRTLERRDDAEREYRRAIEAFTELTAADPSGAADRQSLASAFNWLGETLRLQAGQGDAAARAYDEALKLQQHLVAEHPHVAAYQLDLARTLSNRGILRSRQPDGGAGAEADFRESMRLLQPRVGDSTEALQEMGRVANNLAAVLDLRGASDARSMYEQAVAGHEQLVGRFPENREYQLELAMFSNNLAVWLHERDLHEAADRQSRRAVELMTALARPAPSLAIERADTHTLRGMILQADDRMRAEEEYDRALALFAEVEGAPGVVSMPALHMRFGDLLINLADFASGPGASAHTRELLTRGLDHYATIAARVAQSGTPAEARVVLETITRVTEAVGERDSKALSIIQDRLRSVGNGAGR